MCKFDSRKAPGYLNVATQVRKWVGDAPPVIQSRFVAERQKRLQERQNEARELLGYLNTEQPSRFPPTSGSSTAMTPGTLQNMSQPQRHQTQTQPSRIENSRPLAASVFEVSEVEEKEAEMVDRG